MEMLAIIRGFTLVVLSQLAGAVDFTDSYGDWEMLIHFENSQYNAPPYQLFDTSTATTFIENADNPSAMTFMKVGAISDWTPYRGSDGKLTYQVLWNRAKQVSGGPWEHIFKQDNPPNTFVNSVTGFEDVHFNSRLTTRDNLGTTGDTTFCIIQMGGIGWWYCLAPMSTWDIGSPGPTIDFTGRIAFSATTYILRPPTTTITTTNTSTTTTNTSTTETWTTTTLTNTTATLTTTTLTNTSTTLTDTSTTATLTTTTLTTTTLTTTTLTTTTLTTTTSTDTSTTATLTTTTLTTTTPTTAKSTTGRKGSATSKNATSATPAPTSKPSPAPTPKPTSSAPTPAAGTTKASEIKLSMRIVGISYAELQNNKPLKQEVKAGVKKVVAEMFNALWTEGPAVSTSDVAVAIREAARRLSALPRLAGAPPRRLAGTGELLVDAVIALPAPVPQGAVERALTAGAGGLAAAMTKEISEIPDIESVTSPGARLATTVTAVVSAAADGVDQTGEASAPAPSEEPSTTPPAPSEEPSTTPPAPSEEPSTTPPAPSKKQSTTPPAPSKKQSTTTPAPSKKQSMTTPAPVRGRNGLPCGDQAAGVCTGNATELCRYDESCSRTPPWRGGLGCNAGGVGQNCRFCGFKFFLPCDFDPSDRSLPCKAEPAAVCAGPTERCYLDRQCTELPPALQGLGCNAGGAGQDCRFCGFGLFPPCPLTLVA